MKICFLSRRFFPTVSGMSVYADNLVRQLADRGHDVVMLSQYYGGETATVYGGGPPPDVPGVEVHGIESVHEQERGDFEADIRVLVDRVTALHEDGPFDVIHAQYGYPTGLAGLIAARRLNRPFVLSIQGGDGHWVGECCDTHKRAMQLVCDEAEALIIGSDTFAREVHDRIGTPMERFTIIPGAVDVGRFHPADPKTVAEHPTRLLYHGRVDRRKGVFELLDAFAALRDDGRNIRLTVSGIGPDYDEAAARCGDIDGATATGYVAYFAAPGVYRAHDVFVSPTHAEGFSNTILEAMGSGLPIVSCRAVGVVDCLRHEENGLLAEVNDAADLQRQIERMLDDAALRDRLAARALDEVRTLYAWRAIAGRIADVYREVLDTPLSTPPDAFVEPELDATTAAPCRFRAQPHLL